MSQIWSGRVTNIFTTITNAIVNFSLDINKMPDVFLALKDITYYFYILVQIYRTKI